MLNKSLIKFSLLGIFLIFLIAGIFIQLKEVKAVTSWTESCTLSDDTCSCSESGMPCIEESECIGANTCAVNSCPARANAQVTDTCSVDYSVAICCAGSPATCSGTSCYCQTTGSCSYTCDAGWCNNDGDDSNGCEIECIPQWSLNTTNDTTADQPIEFRLKWTTTGSLSGYVFSFDNATNKTSYYNFTDTTNNKAYNFSAEENEPPNVLANASETEIPSANYSGINVSDDVYFTSTSSDHPYHKFNITISQAANEIEHINITWEGHTSSVGTVYLYVYNFTDGSWGSSLDSGTGTTDFWLTKKYISSFSDIIQNNKISILAQDPSFGYDQAGASSTSIQNAIQGSNHTIPVAGTADNITAYLNTFFAAKVKCAIYNTTLNLIAETGERSIDTGGSDTWETFIFASPPSLTANTQYWLVCWSNADSFWTNLYGTDVGTTQGLLDGQAYGTWPDPLVPSYSNYNWSIYCNYTVVVVENEISTDFIQVEVKEKQFVNDTWQSMTGTGNWSNVTKVVNNNTGKTIRWIVYANDSNNQWNTSDTFSFATIVIIYTCSPIAGQDWNVECSNMCNITTTWDMEGNILNITGTSANQDWFKTTANIFNYSRVTIENCYVKCNGGCFKR